MRVKDLMTRLPFQLLEHDTLRTALSYMQESKLNTLPVIREDRTLFGVVTRSIMYRAILQDVPLDTPIAPFIRRDAITLTDDTPYNQVVEMVQQSDVGTGIVVDQGNRVEGLFTKTDMIMYLLKSSTVLREQLETLLGSIDLGILMIDHAGEIMYANTAFSQLMKQSQNLTGELVQQILPTMDWQSILRDRQVPAPQKRSVGEQQILVQFSRFSTISNQQGIIAVFQELTHLETIAHELKTVRNLHQLLDTVLEHAYDGIVMIDSIGKINFLSQVMCELFGTSQEIAIGKPVDQIFPSFQLPIVLQTGIAEMSEVLEINGIQYLIHRIPILSDKNIVGAIGKVMFRQLKEVREVAKRLDQLESEVAYYKEQLKKHTSTKFTWDHIISNNPQIERLKRIANQASKGQSTIMLRGDSGTGKELFAHAIHASSNRKNGPFITINCAAIPDQLLESELFGYESGAFTGADRAGKRGKFDLANGGTLFLDEIGDMSPHLQAKLLRVLQEREFYRVGGSERIEVDVRIIAATHKPLEELVESGHFRQDLYYRLHV
ncbi:sigma 54-interacting transcriptional regulator, partial [Brevibacillus sp. SYSU BS000544]|uniref:sigma 54-interacting transcriptional regulator n=1 Tax=Brevibacillus sp. SYSU BS000544 TaxID=3416443 RepID=UPI003CE521FC